MKIRNPQPNCEGDCRFSQNGGESTTLLGWTQEYDKHGNPLNKNPNWIRGGIKCSTCGHSWDYVEHLGEVTWTQKF